MLKTKINFKKVAKMVKLLRGSEPRKDFAPRYGITKSQLSHIENGHRNASLKFLWELHIEKMVSLEFILTGKKSTAENDLNIKEKLSLQETKICLKEIMARLEKLQKSI